VVPEEGRKKSSVSVSYYITKDHVPTLGSLDDDELGTGILLCLHVDAALVVRHIEARHGCALVELGQLFGGLVGDIDGRRGGHARGCSEECEEGGELELHDGKWCLRWGPISEEGLEREGGAVG
jgi:hypothetical protein